MTDNLKPCPFCNCVDIKHIQSGGLNTIACASCHMGTPALYGLATCEKIWNTRAPQDKKEYTECTFDHTVVSKINNKRQELILEEFDGKGLNIREQELLRELNDAMERLCPRMTPAQWSVFYKEKGAWWKEDGAADV